MRCQKNDWMMVWGASRSLYFLTDFWLSFRVACMMTMSPLETTLLCMYVFCTLQECLRMNQLPTSVCCWQQFRNFMWPRWHARWEEGSNSDQSINICRWDSCSIHKACPHLSQFEATSISYTCTLIEVWDWCWCVPLIHFDCVCTTK